MCAPEATTLDTADTANCSTHTCVQSLLNTPAIHASTQMCQQKERENTVVVVVMA